MKKERELQKKTGGGNVSNSENTTPTLSLIPHTPQV